jgi:hypothetical protein
MYICVYFVRTQYKAVFMNNFGLEWSFGYEENKLKLKATQRALKAQKPWVAFYLIQLRVDCIISKANLATVLLSNYLYTRVHI